MPCGKLNSNIRCIEMIAANAVTAAELRLNSNIRCIEIESSSGCGKSLSC